MAVYGQLRLFLCPIYNLTLFAVPDVGPVAGKDDALAG